MRIYGRITVSGSASWTADSITITADSGITADGGLATGFKWIEVQTDSQGYNDLVNVTALAQALLLNLNESPFFATVGIPAQQAVNQQVPPDYYVTLIQQQYAQYFSWLLISKKSGNPPTYNINVITNQGVQLNASVPVPI